MELELRRHTWDIEETIRVDIKEGTRKEGR